ncbi:MAG TPA: ISL3 family transposase [Actinobacteria bacterium]|nr:ISL3 family transposase [Actinomycetota bacterium]
MPLDTSILNIHGYEITRIHGRKPLIYEAKYIGRIECPFCRSDDLRKKDRYIRRLNHETIGLRRTKLHLTGYKFHCQSCKRYFNQRFPGVLKYKRSSEAFREEVFERHVNGHTQSYLSKSLEIGTATVERWFHDFLERKVAESRNSPCPRVMGIDEHFFTKRRGYATTICNLSTHKIYDIVLGRSEKALDRYFRDLKGKDNVHVVVMDLSRTYRNIIAKHFPHAMIVSDRFHVIRLVNHHFLKVWADIDPVGRKNRGLLSLMRRHKWNLSHKQILNLYSYLEGYPGLKAIYDFKQDLVRLLLTKKQTAYQCRRLIPLFLDYIYKLKQSALSPLVTLGKTLESWQEEVVRMFRFTKSNGILEGFHNKMEMISRRSYGFRNFENYRLRVKALCC